MRVQAPCVETPRTRATAGPGPRPTNRFAGLFGAPRYGTNRVLDGIDLSEIRPGRVTATIGPNAAGKSTFLKCLAGLLKPEGAILLDDRLVGRAWSQAQYNLLVSYLPQEYPSTAALTVFEAVLLARKRSAAWRVDDDDLAGVAAVLEQLQLSDLSLRYLNELSSGQRQMIAVAQALAREPRVLLLDEPTSSLDLHRQLDLLTIVRAVAQQRQVTVIIALHDLNLAARFADHVVVLYQSLVQASDTPAEVLTEAMVRQVYGVESRVTLDLDGVPVITPLQSLAYCQYPRAVLAGGSQ